MEMNGIRSNIGPSFDGHKLLLCEMHNGAIEPEAYYAILHLNGEHAIIIKDDPMTRANLSRSFPNFGPFQQMAINEFVIATTRRNDPPLPLIWIKVMFAKNDVYETLFNLAATQHAASLPNGTQAQQNAAMAEDIKENFCYLFLQGPPAVADP